MWNRILSSLLSLSLCVLYVWRTISDQDQPSCFGCAAAPKPQDGIFWEGILWISRSYSIWVAETILSCLSLALQVTQLIRKVFRQDWWNLYTPSFLHCWIFLHALKKETQNKFFTSKSSVSFKLFLLVSDFSCIIFTSVCGFQHLQRAGIRQYTVFQALYYTLVTFSTIGYGDISPDIWPSQLFMMLMILAVIFYLPSQIHEVVTAWLETQKYGKSPYSVLATSEKIVVLTGSSLAKKEVEIFLHEFYTIDKNESVRLVLFCSDLPDDLNLVLKLQWSDRVRYVRGCISTAPELAKVLLNRAKALFFLESTTDPPGDRDSRTVSDSSLAYEVSKHLNQFIQIRSPDTHVFLHHAKVVQSFDILRFALLAKICIMPGFMAFLNYLTDGNTLQCCKVKDLDVSLDGQTFTNAGLMLYQRAGKLLVAVKPRNYFDEFSMALNPGKYTLNRNDTCFVIQSNPESIRQSALPPRTDFRSAASIESSGTDDGSELEDVKKVIPSAPLYPGMSDTPCYVAGNRREPCCCILNQACKHRRWNKASDHSWKTRPILAVCSVTRAVYSFITILRAHYLQRASLHPIVFLFLDIPDAVIQDTIAEFPEVYWMQGSLECLDSLLVAGVFFCEALVVFGLRDQAAEKSHMAIRRTERYFPGLRIIADAINPSAAETVGDTFFTKLLCKSFRNDYLSSFVNLLLQLEIVPSSGFLTKFCVTEDDTVLETYGQLFHQIATRFGEVPVAYCHGNIIQVKPSNDHASYPRIKETQDIGNFVRRRMITLGIPYHLNYARNVSNKVLVNPRSDTPLMVGDEIYVLRPWFQSLGGSSTELSE